MAVICSYIGLFRSSFGVVISFRCYVAHQILSANIFFLLLHETFGTSRKVKMNLRTSVQSDQNLRRRPVEMLISMNFLGLCGSYITLLSTPTGQINVCHCLEALYYGIKHGFSYINIRQVPWEVLKTKAEGRGFQHLPRNLANVNALKNHVRSLLLHKN